ncbi:outer dense fiber protein 3 [Hemicordylus capensis]|uniref:outer dense fiber protein 3 n=1 Tax=Hemicordylus capensis TaxID=884348 RepID=UPI002303ADC7|nr:outer dense fiber protein 3 [Hemicordylus capensis]XP_053153224.1 outer dense fiber protein 3 [Hemicordylus capensis]XP_053153225.1 outer dense fiber protein 3 [Hemicordylus capensis]
MSNGPWVGTWRPHHPRGPVMAQYSSPGPKYYIQGTTGYVSHMPTKRRAPAYSIHGTRPSLSKDSTPGPYNVQSSMTHRGKKTAPAYTMTGRPRAKSNVTPGPASYSPEKANKVVFKRAPAHQMMFRTPGAKVDSTPGPNAYVIPEVLGPHAVATTASPSYSMVGKSYIGCFHEDLHKTPGPAAYKKPDAEIYKKRSPKYSMGARIKTLGVNKIAPGPADYEVGKVSLIKSCAPVLTFGIRHSDYTAPLIVDVC